MVLCVNRNVASVSVRSSAQRPAGLGFVRQTPTNAISRLAKRHPQRYFRPVAFKETDDEVTTKNPVQPAVDKLNSSLNQPRGGPTYDPSAPRVSPAIPAFTRRREVFVGRLAMFGFFSAYLGEILLRTGPIGQLEYELGLPRHVVIQLLGVLVLFNAVAGLIPGSPTWSQSNQQDIAKRPAGPTQDPNAIANPQQYLGVTKPGFSKANELIVGRIAMLGFFTGVAGELITGKGPLAQVAGYIGIPADNSFYSICAWGLIGSALLVTIFGYALDNSGEADSGNDIY